MVGLDVLPLSFIDMLWSPTCIANVEDWNDYVGCYLANN